MPTAPPRPLLPPEDKKEERYRESALALVHTICDMANRFAYGTRSHMPAGLDYTSFGDSLKDVYSFFKERPDWTAGIVHQAMQHFKGPESMLSMSYLMHHTIQVIDHKPRRMDPCDACVHDPERCEFEYCDHCKSCVGLETEDRLAMRMTQEAAEEEFDDG